MRPTDQLVHSRTKARQRFALFPLEGFPVSRLPGWPGAELRVLASPALGAEFVQYLIDMPESSRGEFAADESIETFFFVLSGEGNFLDLADEKMSYASGHFGITRPGRASHFIASTATRLLVLQKRYESCSAHPQGTSYYGHESQVKKEVWADNPHALLQTLIPDDLRYDMAMNIFTFDPGFGLPIVETHVMEHGLLFLQGKGLYFLDGEWMEVQKDDFIWMGPFCPQSFYATGPTPSRYIYYKNVNRDIAL